MNQERNITREEKDFWRWIKGDGDVEFPFFRNMQEIDMPRVFQIPKEITKNPHPSICNIEAEEPKGCFCDSCTPNQ